MTFTTYTVSANDLYALEHVFLPYTRIGVGQLSRFLGIDLGDHWRDGPVRVACMYDENDYWQFDFRKCEITSSRIPGETVKWGPTPPKLPPTAEEAMAIFAKRAGMSILGQLKRLNKVKADGKFINPDTLRVVQRHKTNIGRYYFYANGMALSKSRV